MALLTGAGASSAASSKVFVPNSVGTWCFSAAYGRERDLRPFGGQHQLGQRRTPASASWSTLPPGDAITSAPNASGEAGFSFSFLVTTSGSPTPTIKRTGKLPKGVHFVNNHNGTATISGIPSVNKGIGTYHLTIEALFGKGKAEHAVTQAFVLTVT